VDADLDLDVVLQRGGGAELALCTARARSSKCRRCSPSSGAFTLSIACGDVDGDTMSTCSSASPAANELYLNDGSGAFVDAARRCPSTTTGAGARRSSTSTSTATSTRCSATAATPAARSSACASTTARALHRRALALADAAGPHVLHRDRGRRSRRRRRRARGQLGHAQPALLLPGRRRSRLAARQVAERELSAYAAQFGDVDGDGDADAVLGGGGAALFLNDGAGGFAEVANALFHSNSITSGIALADVDQDGDLDVVAGSTSPMRAARDCACSSTTAAAPSPTRPASSPP
jgi:hypothetical protein